MVLDVLNDASMSGPAILFYGAVITAVGLRHVLMPAGSLIDVVTAPLFQDGARMLAARGVGVVVAAGGLGFVGNGLERLGVDY